MSHMDIIRKRKIS